MILTKNYERGLPSLYSEQNSSLDFLLNFDCGQQKSLFVTIMERNYFCLFCEGAELWEREGEIFYTYNQTCVKMSNSEEGPAVNNEQPEPGTNKN